MSNESLVLIFFLISFFVTMLKFLLGARKDPISYILFFYLLFGFGPVLNYLYGVPIYFGIVQENIKDASFLMMLGIVSFALPHILMQPKKMSLVFYKERHGWGALYPLFLGSIGYGLVKILIMLPYKFTGLSKVELINLALPSIHYIYLLLQLYLCAFYLNVLNIKPLKALYYINFILYVFYCLVIGERDFIFPIFSIFILNIILGTKKDFVKYSIGSFLLIAFSTLIFFFRDESQTGSSNILAGILNQGSILFINTYVLKIIEDGHGLFYGSTYLNSILNLIPSWIYKTDFNLQAWFHNIYAKKSTSGYGFALDAEAYLNFGYPGVIIFFTSFSLWWKYMLSKFNYSDFYRYLIFFSIGFTMYSLRNDSLSLFKGTLYAVIIYVTMNTVSYLMAIRRKE